MSTDVAIWYVPSDGNDWASYINDKLVSQPYKINCELIDASSNSHTKDVDALQQSKVNVFFITPDFLEHSGIKLLERFEKNTTVIVLAGVEREDLDMAVTHFKDIFTDSIICDLQQTEESVRDLLITIISVFEDAESPISTPVFDIGDEDHYSVLPKPRQVNALHQVFFKDDKVYVLLDRPADGNLIFNVDGYEAIHPECTEFAVYWFPFKGLKTSAITVFQENNKLGECELNAQTTKTISATSKDQTETSATSKDQNETKTCVRKSFKDNSTQTNTILDKNFEIIPGSAQDNSEVKEMSPRPWPCATKSYEYVNVVNYSKDISTTSKTEQISPLDRKLNLDKFREFSEDETDPVQLVCDRLQIEKNGEIFDKKMASTVECSETFKNLSYSRTEYHEDEDDEHDSSSSSGSVETPRSSTTARYVDTPPIHHKLISNTFKRISGSFNEDDSDENYYDNDVDDSKPYVNMRVSTEFENSPMRSHTYQGEHQTNNNTGDLKQETTIEKHKDIEVTADPVKVKRGILKRLFKPKKKRNKSDPMPRRDSPKLPEKVAKVSIQDKSQHSIRSSGTSSSTSSIYSNESFSRSKDVEEFEHKETRNSGKMKTKNEQQMFFNSKNRKSMRIKHATEDKNLNAPHIPQKKTTRSSVL